MQHQLLLILLLFLSLSCTSNIDESSEPSSHDIKFEQFKWLVKKGADYPYRYQMLNDILYTDTVRALSGNAVLEMLGKPDRSEAGHLYYQIEQTRLGIWPLHTKTMVIKLAEDSTITWIKVHE